MTRAERIEFLLNEARDFMRSGQGVSMFLLAQIEAALALPPDVAPRRLTAEDIHMCSGQSSAQWMADRLNARIFGEQK